MGRRPYD